MLSTAQLLQPWNQIGHHHPHCLLHTVLHILLDLYHRDAWKPSFAKIWHQHNLRLKLWITLMSRGCQVSLKTFKIAQGTLPSLLQWPVAPWHTVWEPQTQQHSDSLGFWCAVWVGMKEEELWPAWQELNLGMCLSRGNKGCKRVISIKELFHGHLTSSIESCFQ